MQDNKMADQEYQKKLESLQKYIPFLVNMMVELKSKGNREAQLTKIQSLHDMITDTRKKLKVETLTRCEEVLTNIYFKVNPQLRSSKSSSSPTSPHTLPGIESPRSTPQSPSPTRDIVLTKPVTIPTEKVASIGTGFSTRSSPKSNRPRVDVYSNAVINSPVAKAKTSLIPAKVPDMSKPPISLDDLKTLEDDVHKKINDATFVNKTVDELQEVKKQIQLQLRVEEVTAAMGMDEPINTTVRNTLMLSKRSHEGKGKCSEQPKSSKSAGKAKEDDRISKESPSHKSTKKCFKDFDMFGNLLSSIDDKLIEETKKCKKGDRRPSLTLCKEDSASTFSLSPDKGDNVKKGKDKASGSSKQKSSSVERDKKTEKKKEDKFGTKDNQGSESNCTDAKDEDNDKKDEYNITDDEIVKDLMNSPTSELDFSDLLKNESFIKVSEGSKNASASTNVISKPVPTYKRLADKYNPKPKQKITDIDNMPDVDKAVSESIEKLMKASPAKTFPRPLEQPRFALDENEGSSVASNDPSKPVQLPDILQRIFNKPLLGDIIPKRLNASPVASPSHSMPNRFQNNNFVMGKPGPVEPPKALVLSPQPQSLQFQPPHFLSPPRPPEVMLSPDIMARPPLLPTPSSGHGILPTPPIPPNLPTGFLDNGMDRGFNNPRLDFEMPGTPMADFEPPRLEFEPPPFIRNDNINMNPQFIPPVPEHQMRGFDARNANFMARGPFPHRPEINNFNHYDLGQGPGAFYGANQVMHSNPEVPVYMPEPTFFQERFRWVRDRRPGDPRNYREYKEMKERQEREARVVKDKQKEIKDPRLASRDSRLAKEANIETGGKDKSELVIRDPRLSRGREKSVERDVSRDRQEFLSRERARSRERFRDTSKESRSRESRFDKMYSVTSRARSRSPSRTREEKNEDDEAFMSPLDSLYNVGEKGKTGKGYGVQKFRIPRKSRKDKEQRSSEISEEDRQSNNTGNKSRTFEMSDSEDSDTNDDPIPDNDSDVEVIEEEQEGEVDNKNTCVTIGDSEIKETIDKAASVSEFDCNISRIKVVLNSDTKAKIDVWESSEMDDFISEYDREFQNMGEDDDAGDLKADSPSKTAQRDVIKDSELDVQVEEPSSSQDVLEQLPKTDSRKVDDLPKKEDDFNKSAELTEADSSRKSDGIATPQEMTSKSDEPSEQNILAHFFENLLKSRNKKDKKTALFSLIETFSDSFDDKEIQKIRKIINVNEGAVEGSDEEKEEASSSLQNQAPVAQEEQPVVGSTTGEEQVFTEKPEVTNVTENKPLENAPVISQTQVNEVTKSTDESTPQCNEDLKSEEPLSETKDLDVQSTLEPVVVSVGERIKNRKRNPAVNKPKKKFKSELDLLHEDIQDMFIRDGVLTATGKRMCRILKDDPNALASSNQATSPVADPLKKARKKPGPKRKVKSNNQEIAQNSIKDMRVVINKIPDDVLNVSSGHTRQLRSRTRQSSYVETDDETPESIVDDESVVESFDAGSDKSDLEEDSANESGEDDKNYANTEDMPKPKMKRRKAAKWASGIIPKSKKRKTQHSKSRENSSERTGSPVSITGNDVSSFSESDADKLVEPDKEYYYDYANKRKLNCKLCKYSGHLLTGHYLKEHPHSEVLCSRFSPQIADEAIKDFTENGKLLESVLITKMRTKYHYCCRMCGYQSFVSPIFFYEHVTTHTGEYRHQCGTCEYFAVTSKTMASHFANVHPDQERKTIKKTYTLAIIFAYMCGECNFVQLKEKSVEDHANIFHLGEKPVIYKINMSTVLDPRLFNYDGAKAIESKPNESSLANQMPDLNAKDTAELESTQVEATVKRRKPGPKSKVAVEETVPKEEKKDDVKPVWRKRPGPKSKTLPISEYDAAKPTDVDTVSSVVKSKKPGPKSKTEKPKAEEISTSEADEKETIIPPAEVVSSPEDGPVKNTPTRKRRRSVDKLISEDSGDDLDTIITLSSRSSRAAKEKATAKLKTMMENSEGSLNKRKTDVESPKKINTDDEKPTTKTEQQTENEQAESKGGVTQKETHHVAEMRPPSVEGKPDITNEKDLNVFTCKTDILQEDAKKIEEDRLRKMNELNKSIISRTLKLDFINKLSDKLNEQQSNDNLKVRIKQEPADNDVNKDPPQPAETSSEPQLENRMPELVPKAPISKAPVVSKKPVFEEQPTVQQPSINFRQNKPNSLFSNMIEKLQGKVNEAAVQQENVTDSAEATKETSPIDNQIPDASEVYITIGDLIRATKIDKEIIYSCHANNCYVATKDKVVFQLHCKFGHKELTLQSSLCEKCGVVISVTPDTTLLENLYDHLVFAHSDFIGKSSVLRMRRLSGDKLSVKKEKEAATPKLQDFEADINRHVLERVPVESAPTDTTAAAMETEPSPAASLNAKAGNNEEPAEENPFSFKIANVMSLAESGEDANPQSIASKPLPVPPLKRVPPLTLINAVPKQQTSTQQQLVVKEAKLTTAELSRPKKAPKALQKFIECPGDLYKCPHFYCMFSTNIRTLLTCHLKAHKCDSATMVPCVYCDMKTPWEHVPMHIDIRHASCKYSCSYCLYRAALKEYVFLHQEQSHPDLDYIVIALPHKATKKFSIADSKIDYKVLCEPFRCFCKDKEGGDPVLHEYLFETEFVNHLNNAHPSKFASCGYPKCCHEVSTFMMLHHWAVFHGICTYQCSYCKTSSKDISRMYTHFSQIHPNMIPDILVRKNDFLPQDRELRFSDKAFQQLGHIRKVPATLLTSLGNRAQRTIKLIPLNSLTGTSEDSNASSRVETSGIAPGASLVMNSLTAVTQSHPPQLFLSKSNLQLIVASTSGSNEKLYLLPTSMVSSPKGHSVTSVAPVNKVTVQTSTSSKSVLNRTEAAPREPVKIGDITIYPSDGSEIVLPTSSTTPELTISAVTSSSSLASHSTVTMLSKSLFNPSVTASSAQPDKQPLVTPEELDVEERSSAKQPKLTAKIKSISKLNAVSSTNNDPAEEDFASRMPFQDDITSENDSTAVSEDDILQSAIQSILDQDDDSNNSNTRLGPIVKKKSATDDVSKSNTPVPLLSEIILDPPPLVLISNSSPASKSSSSTSAIANNQMENEHSSESVTPVEHVEVGSLPEGLAERDEEDPLNLGSNDGSNLEVPFIDDNNAVDPLSEDPLTIPSILNSDLSSGDPLSIDESVAVSDPLEMNQPDNSVIQPTVPENAGIRQNPVKIGTIQRSVSMASTSDDESDSSNSEKKKRGLIGYQLFRCAVCNLSFSNVKPFKSHIATSTLCKKLGLKAFQCVHCERVLKTPQRLADHIMTHGVQRFSCSLCSEKFTTLGITRLHMKNRHSIHQTNLIPMKADRKNMEMDDFVIKPCQSNSSMGKEKEALSDILKSSAEDFTYTPDQIEVIPIRQIFSTNVKCGLCNYQTKVRVNIIRHLQMHLDEKAVPDTAPVNPVPCLEKNEKMFDKMINLAASSITTSGRMGGAGKDKEKEEEKYPEFIPTHRRFVCCAQGCSYLCPEEANLKHHLVALHSDEFNFTCAHCKIKIEPIDIENVIKHFKLHGLHLYKCQYCSLIHHLKHKVEKHVLDGHLDMAVKVVTVRSMDSEPQDFAAQEEAAAPQPTVSSKFKPWSCRMCKAKYHTKGEIQVHIMKKHNIDTQYKCTLCAFKNDQEESCREHFKEKHPSHAFDIIFVYQKIEEETPKDESTTPFDTTPLWQRDKPRVRHIRGILFDEVSPQPTKSPKKTRTYGNSSKVSVASTSKNSATATTSTSKTMSSTTSHTAPKAAPNASTSATSKATPNVSSHFSKNLFDCIDAVARGVAGALQNKPGSSGISKDVAPEKEEAGSSSKKDEVPSVKSEFSLDLCIKTDIEDESVNDDVVLLSPQSPKIIVIDSDESDAEIKPKGDENKGNDDDTPKTKDKDSKTKPMAKNRCLKRQGTDLLKEAVKLANIEEPDDEDSALATICSKQSLTNVYGQLGMPHNKQWKCPKCKQFKSKRVGDFIFHLYKDFSTFRFRCKMCSDFSITYKYMQDHVKVHPGYNDDIIEPLPPNVKFDTWVHMVLREQSLCILKNVPLFKKQPISGPTDITCYFCNEKFMSVPECCEHMLYHWAMMPYQCQHCPHEFYTVYDLKHHHKIEHPDAKLYSDPKGPTLAKALQCIENRKKRPLKFSPDTTSKKKPRTDDNSSDCVVKKESVTSGVVINTYKAKRLVKFTSNLKFASGDVINIDDDEDDLMIVSKTDDNVPSEDDVFACELCVYIADTEVLVMKHLHDEHQILTNKYHILSKKKSETDSEDKLACNICDEVFTELKLRRHFIENHFEGQIYAPYKFKCALCSNRFLTPSRVKMHFSRVHAGVKLQFQCVIPQSNSNPRKPKLKQYFCTLCPYTTFAVSTISVKAHLKGHLKPMLCKYCNLRFRYDNEVLAHTAKQHPGQKPWISTLEDVMQELADAMKTITERAVEFTGESIVCPVVPDKRMKNVAKKSTSTPFTPPITFPQDMDEFLDLSRIVTTFELNDLEYTTTAEEMMKMINMDTYVDVSDCMDDETPSQS